MGYQGQRPGQRPWLGLALGVSLIDMASVSAQAPGQRAEELYKNIQVMKGVPANLVAPTMQLMEIALGVHCNHCHDNDNTKRDLDVNPEKETARRMMRMVADLNRVQFERNEVVVGGRTAWVVSGSTQWLPKVRLYFDRDTASLLSLSYQQKSGYCCHVFRIDYDNFYIINGIRMPLQWTTNGPRESILVYKFDRAQASPIEDTRFARPAAATAAR